MKLKDFKFKLTNTETGESAVLTFDDLYAYEGEVCGIVIYNNEKIPKSVSDELLSYNSGYGHDGCNDIFDIEAVES